MTEKTARCLGWLEGFSETVRRVVSAETSNEYDRVVKELADELTRTITANPYGVVTVPLTNPPSVPQYPNTIPTTKPIITCEVDE